ncbi:MAG TPA: MlaD family protein [Acidobacteriaceae bacterium]|nr:MlaD family protein [Acidobacteriaceae bacterium]
MPSQQEVKWSQLKVGVLVLISLALLIILLFLMTSASGMATFEKKLLVRSYFANSEGVKVGAPVNLEGVTIGEVRLVRLSTDPARKLTPVEVTMKLSPHFQDRVHTDTTASLETTGVIGDTVLELNSELAHGPEVQSGDELPTFEAPSIATFVKSSQGTLNQLNASIGKLDKLVDGLQNGEGTAGQLLKNPALYNEATATLNQLHALSTDLNRGRGSVGKLLTDDTLYNRLNDTANRLDTLTTGLSTGKGSAGKLLTDDTLYNNLNTTLTRTNSILAQVDSGQGSLGLLLKDPATAQKLSDTINQLDTMLAGVNAGKGTVGQLVTNDAAYNNLNVLLKNASELATMLRTDPKKYLTIHMKIF